MARKTFDYLNVACEQLQYSPPLFRNSKKLFNKNEDDLSRVCTLLSMNSRLPSCVCATK
jgi:hypothetical protein